MCVNFNLFSKFCLAMQPEPHQKFHPDPEPYKNDAAPQHWSGVSFARSFSVDLLALWSIMKNSLPLLHEDLVLYLLLYLYLLI
jgi:hypothetical protein